MDKKFCPSCGNNTLLRTSTSTDMQGNVRYYMKKNKQFNLRGTKFSLPNPKGGRDTKDAIVLREDQAEYQRGLQRKKKELLNVFDPDYVPPWLAGSEKRSHSFGKLTIGFGRRNPNEARKTGNKKKK
jgi:RNA-binding protein NOB1